VTFPKIPWRLVLGGVVLLVVAWLAFQLDLARRGGQKAETAAFVAEAKLHGAVVAKRISKREAEKMLSKTQAELFAALKKADKRARVDSIARTDVKIEDTPAGSVVEVPGGPSEWRDEFHRFRLELPSGPFRRRQAFRHDQFAVRAGDGKTVVQKSEFREFDPETGAEIPLTGVTIDSSLAVVDAPKAAPPIIHPRLVAGIDIQGSPGAGLEIINLERTYWPGLKKLTISLIGYWDRKAGEGRGVAQVGYRVLNSNVTVGPYAGVSTSGALVFGAGAAIQVTR